ncbi:hypothetical protein RFI_01928, partial [Reticulomyxa filosa]
FITKPLPSDDPKKRKPDITLAKTYLKWEPTVHLEKGLSATIDYFVQYLDLDKQKTQDDQNKTLPVEDKQCKNVFFQNKPLFIEINIKLLSTKLVVAFKQHKLQILNKSFVKMTVHTMTMSLFILQNIITLTKMK